MTRQEYQPEIKAAAMAALLAGQAVNVVAAEYRIPVTTLRAWKSKQRNGEAVVTVITEKREAIGDLLFGYLTTMLRTLRVQAEHFGDQQWLAKQTASDLAILHGVTTDKAIRLLEALGRAGDAGDSAQLTDH